jgi:predicted transcriptional regulator
MNTASNRKNKIILSDYNYKKDLENRLFMANLSVFEVDVLREILNQSLKISIESLREQFEITSQEMERTLDKLSASKLFQRQGALLVVDKEMRKYYETQIEKFDDQFEPDMEFLQGLLNKVPIWYMIPRHSDNIFASIVEKYFLTPKTYLRYLEELQFDHPILHKIVEDLYSTPDLRLPASTVIERYHLTREQFEEYLLLLEYHFVCCLSYSRIEDKWHEMITPFHEWREYYLFESRMVPQVISDVATIQRTHEHGFGFILEMEAALKSCQEKKISYKKALEMHALSERILNKLITLQLAEKKGAFLQITPKGKEWLLKSTQEQSIAVANHPLNQLHSFPETSSYTLRHVGEVERSLKRLSHKGWVYLDDFLKGLIVPLGEREAIVLKNRGKKWKYVFPSYTEEELSFIKAIIKERLFEIGVIATGLHQNKECFALTPYGCRFLT